MEAEAMASGLLPLTQCSRTGAQTVSEPAAATEEPEPAETETIPESAETETIPESVEATQE